MASESQSYQQKCDRLVKESEIRFAGFLDLMGNLVVGKFMFIEAVLRIRTRQEFDENLGLVEYAAARRTNVVTLTFLVDDMVLFVSAEPNVDIDITARKILKIIE
jgi:hypothetical protein